MKRLALLFLLFFHLAVGAQAAWSWVPLRFAVDDSYTDADDYESEASNVYGLRFGLLNAVNRDVYGLSMTLGADGGVDFRKNFVDDNFGGIKLGVFFTTFAGTGLGFQFAGLVNSAGNMRGIQFAGLYDKSSFLRGGQVASLACYSEMEMYGFQIAGLGATVGSGEGGAEAGGLQFGGLWTACRGSFSGMQIGCVNFAHELHGVQLGVINNTDSLRGIQIGAINISGTFENHDFFFFPVVNARF